MAARRVGTCTRTSGGGERAKSKMRAWRRRSRRNALDSTLIPHLVAAMSLNTTLLFIHS